MRWFEQQRMDWIAERIRTAGFINRKHLIEQFGISVPQASNDLRRFQERHPGSISYDLTRKRYVRATNGERRAEPTELKT